MNATTLLIATAVLGAGTFAFRFAGPLVRNRFALTTDTEKLISMAAVILLTALVATSALTAGHEFVGIARPAGVAIGGVLAWRKAPLAVVVVAAATTAAGLRFCGVP